MTVALRASVGVALILMLGLLGCTTQSSTTTKPTPSTSVTATPTPSPPLPMLNSGTYWTCTLNETDTGIVFTPPGSYIASPACDPFFTSLPPGVRPYRVAVGGFTPYPQCGAMVTNILDPHDPQAAPQSWPADHELLFDGNWHPIPTPC